jgi:hypothetical protein
LLRAEYHLPFLRSHLAAWCVARAGSVFAKGDERRARRYLGRYFVILRNVSKTAFDPILASRLELKCWIAWRGRSSLPAGDLERSIAAVAAELYQVPADRLANYARWRTGAILLRDTQPDWKKIGDLLYASEQELHKGVNQP